VLCSNRRAVHACYGQKGRVPNPTQTSVFRTAGVCLYVILAGCLPFESASMPELLRRIQRGQYETPPWMSPAAARVIASLLQPDPRQRCAHQRKTPATLCNARNATSRCTLPVLYSHKL